MDSAKKGQGGDAMSEMNPTGRFSDRAELYRRCRPDYPRAAIDAVLAGLGDPATLVCADIGAGTGISARSLAQRGARVHALEPNAEMRRMGEAEGAGPGAVEWRDASAERTGLPDGSVDVVMCAQAFHWFRAAEALDEFARILRSGRPSERRGRIALVWNDRDPRDPFTSEYSRLIRAVSGGHAAEKKFDPRPLVDAHGGFGPMRLVEAAHEQRLTEEGVVGRAMSASYVPKEGETREWFERDLREAFRRHARGGKAALVYVTRVYLAEARG